MRTWTRFLGVTAALTLATGVVAGCSSDDAGTTSDGKVDVVASTDVWGAVASAIGGEHAQVTALYTSPDGDPHEFEASAKDTARVSDAGVVVLNGGHYDAYMEEAPKGPDAIVVNAFDLMEGAEHSEEEGHEHADGEAHEEEGHDHTPGAVNEHVFYNLTVVGEVANKIANALSEKDSANEQYYRNNAGTFNEQIAQLQTQLAAIKAADPGAQVAQTEPLAGYLLAEAGLEDITPAGFQDAVEAGQSPSARDVAATQDLLRDRKVRALVYNTQAVDESAKALLDIANTAGVPVVDFTETLPVGVTDYIAWQRANVETLTSALASGATSTP
ncbi:zinc ABC transporter substrate-binding protein [Williamsia sp. 1135]|uniref:metal ABC transporter solute-binding protein, Zn/Mn family n=1 Tax=Williamsia sp. 1135 TaxID=1889262 RepID=UPI000A1022F8|nr:zinc ABC transporter substrate-binding protein [Williamsia sp. 1135]ORM32879.1 ABC transporter substrate-binding protein [Williamsia sp. 1135]